MTSEDKGVSVAVRNLKKLGYRCVDVSNDSRHKGYNILGWKNGEKKKIGVESTYDRFGARPRFSRDKRSACDMLVISKVKTGQIEIMHGE